MANHIIRFVGKISWEGRANGLPEEIYAFLMFDGYNAQVFNEAIEAQTLNFIRFQAMPVQQDQGQIIDMRQMPSERMLVPFKWIVSIHAEVINVTGEISQLDESGVERLADGTEPVKQ